MDSRCFLVRCILMIGVCGVNLCGRIGCMV